MQVPLAQPLLWQQVMTGQEQLVSGPSSGLVISPQAVPNDRFLPIPVVVKNGWVVQGMNAAQPRPAYIPQPVHYVTVHPGISVERGVVEKGPSLESFGTRPVLMAQGGNIPNSGRSLRGNQFASRRQSDECQSEIPVKKLSIGEKSLVKVDTLNVKDRDRYILQNIEYYFSDENLSKNAYLLKQVLHENGYVSLKRVAALKRVKLYTRDEQVVAQCIRLSEKLELNEDGTMVRRKDPLPYNIEPPRFVRSVIAINLPMQVPTIEAVTSLFGSYGDLTQVRILKPGKKLPTYLIDYQAWIPDLGEKYCALVEFESQDEAQRACREINMKNRTNESLRVALLKPGARLRRTLYRKYKGPEENSKEDIETYSDRKESKLLTPTNQDSNDYDASCSGSNSESETNPLQPQLPGSDGAETFYNPFNNSPSGGDTVCRKDTLCRQSSGNLTDEHACASNYLKFSENIVMK